MLTRICCCVVVVVASTVASSALAASREGEPFVIDGRRYVVAELDTLPYVENEFSKRYRFDAHDNPKLKQLRAQQRLDDVVKDGVDEFDRQVRLLDWAHRRLPRFGRPTSDSRGALDVISASDGGHTFFCAHYGDVLVSAAAGMGWVCRPLALRRPDHLGSGSTEHTSTEIWSNQHRKWVMLDPTFAMYVEKAGVPLNAYELRNEWLRNDGRDLAFVLGKDRKRYRRSDLPVFIGRHPGFGELNLDASALNVYAFIGYVPSTDLMDRGPDWGNMFITQDDLCGTTKWHKRAIPRDPATEPYFPINQAALTLTPAAGGLKVKLKTLTPNFKTFSMRVDGGVWKEVGDTFVWPMNPAGGRLEVKSINQFGVDGPASVVELKPAAD
jgi:hypothetical protein